MVTFLAPPTMLRPSKIIIYTFKELAMKLGKQVKLMRIDNQNIRHYVLVSNEWSQSYVLSIREGRNSEG